MVRPDRALEAEVVLRAQGRRAYCHIDEYQKFNFDSINQVYRRLTFFRAEP